VPCITTLSGATAAVQAMARAWKVDPKPLQELHLGPHVDTRTPA